MKKLRTRQAIEATGRALTLGVVLWHARFAIAQPQESPPASQEEPAPPNALPTEPLPVAKKQAQAEEPEVRFSFQEAEWPEVFRWLAELSGRSLVQEATPPGKFSYFDTRAFTIPEAIDVVNSVLLSKGFALIQRDNFLIAADLREGVPPHLVQRVSIDELPSKARTELVKVLVTLEGLIAEEAKKEFEPMKGPHGTILALPTTNQLLLIDTAKNVQQIVDLINEIEGDEGKADLKAFPLKYVSAVEVEKVVRDLLGVPQRSATSGPAPQTERSRGDEDGRDRFREMIMQRFMGGGGGDGDRDRGRGRDSRSGGPGQPSSTGGKGPFVSIDERTNTLFVTATPDKIALVSQVIRALDVPQEDDSADLASQTPRIEVYPVAAGTAEGLAQVMGTVVGTASEVRVSAHPDGRALIVYATPREHEKMKAVLEQLQSEGLRVEVIPLRTLDAGSTANLIRSLLGQKEEDTSRSRFPFFFDRDSRRDQNANTGPAVEADLEQNRLLVRGTEPQIKEIRELLSKLGEVGLGQDRGLEASRYRVVPLGDRDPAELVDTIERLWNRLDLDNPLQIERLPGDAPQIQVPPKVEPKPSPDASNRPPAGDSTRTIRSREDLYRVAYRPDAPGNDRAPQVVQAAAQEPAPEKTKPQPSGHPITIVVGPDNLAITSEDDEALDLIENLVNSVARGRGSANSGFALYYLKSSSAQEMAYLLDEALYGQVDPYATTTSTTPKARIIPDLRTNSLLVVGPPSEQRKIDQLLEVLDRSDPPPTEAMPTPRMIPVRYARASALAQVVRDVFASQLFAPPKPNPAQAAMGFAGLAQGNRNRSAEGESGKMTVGVDEQTNTLIVSAPKSLLDEVERLVATLDESARDNHRTARVVTLKNARPDAVQRALSNLLGTRQAGDLRKPPAESRESNEPDQQPADVRDEILRNLLPGMAPGGGDRGRDFFRDRGRRFDPFR